MLQVSRSVATTSRAIKACIPLVIFWGILDLSHYNIVLVLLVWSHFLPLPHFNYDVNVLQKGPLNETYEIYFYKSQWYKLLRFIASHFQDSLASINIQTICYMIIIWILKYNPKTSEFTSCSAMDPLTWTILLTLYFYFPQRVDTNHF